MLPKMSKKIFCLNIVEGKSKIIIKNSPEIQVYTKSGISAVAHKVSGTLIDWLALRVLRSKVYYCLKFLQKV